MTGRERVHPIPATLVVLATAAVAPAAPLYQHIGSSDPTMESWTLNDYSGLGGSVGPAIDSESSWRTQANPGGVQRYLRTINPADVNDPTGWTYTARAKANFAPEILEASFGVIDSQDWWQLHLITGAAAGVYLMNPDASTGPRLSSADPAGAYHTYQIVFDPNGAGGTGAATYYLDGAAIGSRTRGQNFSAGLGGLYRLDFGDNDRGSAASDSQWALVTFELGQHPVPEPAALLMLSLGGLLAGVRRRTNR